ncbi:TPA: hypothetical protein R4Y39_004748 [Raoultella planticola]|nr:hypothetical protein [Raoultella planticola]
MRLQKPGAKCVETIMPDKIVICGMAGMTTSAASPCLIVDKVRVSGIARWRLTPYRAYEIRPSYQARNPSEQFQPPIRPRSSGKPPAATRQNRE